MGDSISVAVEEEHDLDWEHVFDTAPEVMADLFGDNSLPPSSDLSLEASGDVICANSSPDSLSSWIGEIEHLLMKDDDDCNGVLIESNPQFCNDFLADILLDSPADPSAENFNVSERSTSSPLEDGNCSEREKIDAPDANSNESYSNNNNNNDSGGEEEDPISKKRRRQLRNRDAALRSRERKKMHLRDLETKSRYFEGECRRLGRLLQCCVAENHALRLQLHNGQAFGASMTKQESAVLLLESLLLGSLFWFLGIICLLLPLPPRPRLTPESGWEESDGGRALERAAPRGARSKSIGLQVFKSKRCKASRTKMKPTPLPPVGVFGARHRASCIFHGFPPLFILNV
ncbi:bZIP transcription factor 60 [Malania oleifera]|uniref:bZIP transcription factor 60 n=1 Tax=Malania oleifera TaxID=397392 RepID=UPI0025AE0EE7|nr:bZIP transcription factor 60 [Malania oleifera]